MSLENKNSNLLIDDMNLTKRRLTEAVEALEVLVNIYVANQGTDSEFISCITPKSASFMTQRQRKECCYWKAWDEARKVIAKVNP